MAVKKKVKVKRTKWTPKRIYLLFAVMLLSFVSLFFIPWTLILGVWAWLVWIQAWKEEPNYGYKKDGSFDWSFWI